MKIVGLVGGSSGGNLIDVLHSRGYRVAAICGKEKENGSDTADYLKVTDLDNHEEIKQFFTELNIRNVIFGTGHYKAIQLAGCLEKSFCLNIDYDRSCLAKDKAEFKKKLVEIAVATPGFMDFDVTCDIDEVIARVGLPCVLKAKIDSVLPQRANSREELSAGIREILATNSGVLAEQYIEGNDCTVAVDCRKDSWNPLAVTYWSKARDFHLKGFPGGSSERLPESVEQELLTTAGYIAKSLGYRGLIRVDYIVDKHFKPYVLELNSVIVTNHAGFLWPIYLEQNNIRTDEAFVENALAQFAEFENE